VRYLDRSKLPTLIVLSFTLTLFPLACQNQRFPTVPPGIEVDVNLIGSLTYGPDSLPAAGVIVYAMAMNVSIPGTIFGPGSPGTREQILGQETTDMAGQFRIQFTVQKKGEHCFNSKWWEVSVGGLEHWFQQGNAAWVCRSGPQEVHLHLPDYDPTA